METVTIDHGRDRKTFKADTRKNRIFFIAVKEKEIEREKITETRTIDN
jgi:hypothetical protein